MGLIGYFESDCPSGWIPYVTAAGRTIIGSGVYLHKTPDGRSELFNFSTGNIGGEISHTLT